MTGTVTLIGAGELAAGGARLHRAALAGLEGQRVVFLDTPAGFETNIDVIDSKAVEYYRRHFRMNLAVARYRSRDRTGAAELAKAIAEVRAAQLIFAGPGSPTFAIAQWRGSPLWAAVVERFEAGARLLFASAAAISLGRYALPVYEIYKAGGDPHWVEGLDLFGRMGLALAVAPHYDDQSGGELYDSRFCFMGAERFAALRAQLPADVTVLGIDGNTAVTLDPSTQSATVVGLGRVTVIGDGEPIVYGPGDVAPFAALRRSARPAAPAPKQRGDAPVEPRPAADDFDAVISYVEGIASLSDAERIELLARVEGLRDGLASPQSVSGDALVDVVLELRAALREAARYAAADRAREALVQLGYVIADTPEGPRWTKR